MKVVGHGAYGKVFLVQHKQTRKHHAMKVIKKELVYRTNQEQGIQAEREIMQRIEHPFIMKLEYAFQDTNNLYMVMEFVNGGELLYHMTLTGKFDEPRARFYAA